MTQQEQALVTWIDEHQDELIQITKDLIAIRSVSADPDANERYDDINAYLDKTFKSFGLNDGKPVRNAENNGGANYVCVMKGTGGGKNMGMGGHTDIVPADEPDWITGSGYKCEVIGDKIYGRGTADMKGGLAACIIAMKALHELKVPLSGDVVFVGAVDEEIGSPNGMKYLIESGAVNVDFFMNAEQTTMKAMTGYKGNCFLNITVEGVSAHGSTPHLGVNAIEKAAKVINVIKQTGLTWKEHPFMGKSTINIGIIQGGSAANVVPSECMFTMDIRMIEGMTLESTIAEVRALFERMMREDPELKIKAEFRQDGSQPRLIPDEDAFVQALKACGNDLYGKDLETASFISAGDMNHFLNRGVPGIMIGPGCLDDIHKLNEYCYVSELVDSAKLYALACAKLCK